MWAIYRQYTVWNYTDIYYIGTNKTYNKQLIYDIDRYFIILLCTVLNDLFDLRIVSEWVKV